MSDGLDAFDRWMVRSNLDRIAAEGLDVETVVAQVKANGYHRVAAAVEAAAKSPDSKD
jgi:alanine racemase